MRPKATCFATWAALHCLAAGCQRDDPGAAAAAEDAIAKLEAIERRLDTIELEAGVRIRRAPSHKGDGPVEDPASALGAVASNAAGDRVPGKRLVLRLAADGLRHGDRLLDKAELTELVRTAMRRHSDASATLLADDDVPAAVVTETLDTVRRAGLKRFSFATRPRSSGEDEWFASSSQ